MKVSVIIPVYKVEKYLRKCVDSVINQKLDNIEIILVDDGSPDNCPQICDDYQANYDYVKVIHKPNGGLSSARNAGIKAATGDYLIFMDSDDWWNPDVDMHAVLDMVAKKPSTEMFLFTSLDYIEGKGYFKRAEHERLKDIRTDTVEHYYEDLLKNGNLEVSAATKIISKDFLTINQLYFKESIVCEDSEWMLRVLRALQKVEIINQPIYICRMGRAGSITNTIGKKNLLDLLEIINSSVEYYKENDETNNRKRYEFCYCAYLWFCALGLSADLSRDEFIELKPLFKETSVVCKYSDSPKTLASYRIYHLFGIHFARLVLGLYLKLKHRLNINKKKQETV